MKSFMLAAKAFVFTSLLSVVYFLFGLYVFFETIFGHNATIVPDDIGLWLYTMPWSLLIDPGPLKSFLYGDSSWREYVFYAIFLILNSVILYFIGKGLTKWLGMTGEAIVSLVVIVALIGLYFWFF